MSTPVTKDNDPIVWEEPEMICVAPREGQVLEHLLNGRTYREIGFMLKPKVGEAGVKTLVRRILDAFGVSNRNELSAAVFIQNGWKEGRRQPNPTVVRIIMPRHLGEPIRFERLSSED